MSYIFRAIFILLALAVFTSAKKFLSSTTLCLFKGHPKYDPQEIMFWVEEKGNKNHMPFYSLSDLGYSDFKSIKVALKDGLKGNALLYLYDNREAEDENVAFVKFEKTAYHFSGSESLDFELYREVGGAKVEIALEVGGEKVVVDFGSCVKPEYHWNYDVSSTEAIITGDVKRANNYP
ncbi:hypothetical protein V1520DRAFT_350232 [Lipomyces starkeyi]|uniref:Uncharacterized protein n=1 Tax=Lipomyces starkeyi NRRL Y-11557 TaxID=675824 RepID=A0A1E3QHB7_LIPST|nr:hypothetical protein LIPSTDRAFT_109020 [Lipomyces starkeyi NRRL Y-11557]